MLEEFVNKLQYLLGSLGHNFLCTGYQKYSSKEFQKLLEIQLVLDYFTSNDIINKNTRYISQLTDFFEVRYSLNNIPYINYPNRITNIITSSNGSGVGILHNLLSGLQGGDGINFYHVGLNHYNAIVTSNQASQENPFVTLNDLSLLATPPTYTLPTSSLNNIQASYEIGSTVNINLLQSFIQNDAGSKISETVIKNGIVVSNIDSFSETLIVPEGNTIYSGNVNYSQGNCKQNNLGIIDCNGRIIAGSTISSNRIITGLFRRFAGSVNEFPIDGTSLRLLLLNSSTLISTNNFTFTTGTVNRKFVIAIPSSKNLVSVQNTGTNEFLNFILNNSISQIPDANGVNQNYKYYTLENAVPFSSNYILNVIIS